jgi:hypothetical protein
VGATAKQQQTHPKVSEKKWATGQSCIRKRSTTCKIGTLVTKIVYEVSIFVLEKNAITFQ